MMKRKYEIIFIFGFTALFLCGIGDWLIGYEPPGGTPLIFGISSTSIADVPVWFYIVSLGFGILSGFGCMVFGPAMVEVLEKNGINERTLRLSVGIEGINDLLCEFGRVFAIAEKEVNG